MAGRNDDDRQEEHGYEHMHNAAHLGLLFLIRIAVLNAQDVIAHCGGQGCECAVSGGETR